MNLVADTHALVWYLSGRDRRLSVRARRAFAQAEASRLTIHVPAAVLMELVLLEQAGRLRISYRDLRDQLALRPGFPLQPTTPEDVDEARSLGVLVDPFDRLIAGAALRLGLPLLTNDDLIAGSKRVRTYW